MRAWKCISNQEMFLMPLQPILWIEGGGKGEKESTAVPNVTATLQIRSMEEENFSYQIVYDIDRILYMQLEIENKGEKEISRIIVSHMIRDHFLYVPNTLEMNKGTGEFLFQLVRWRIEKLLPNEKARLVCQLKIARPNILDTMSLSATYTFQSAGITYGPLQTKAARIIKR
ncbi:MULTISPECIES: hypothetical protein [unclassified Bacillus cereus group]|uniref:hypothetical protein n=1 Tax=unclassified Bacillus cereus group TaxID=2750818 RepID=UPI001F5888BF|nr:MULTISPECIES: hypothetical protein [unclassified Bacillus cereus group]